MPALHPDGDQIEPVARVRGKRSCELGRVPRRPRTHPVVPDPVDHAAGVVPAIGRVRAGVVDRGVDGSEVHREALGARPDVDQRSVEAPGACDRFHCNACVVWRTGSVDARAGPREVVEDELRPDGRSYDQGSDQAAPRHRHCRPTVCSAPRSVQARRSRGVFVGARGFEPLTSSASRKRSPPELSALAVPRCYTGARGGDRNRTGVRGFAGLCLTTRPPRREHCGHAAGSLRDDIRTAAPSVTWTAEDPAETEFASGADDGIRTRDPHLGKVVLYQLSHVRAVSRPC